MQQERCNDITRSTLALQTGSCRPRRQHMARLPGPTRDLKTIPVQLPTTSHRRGSRVRNFHKQTVCQRKSGIASHSRRGSVRSPLQSSSWHRHLRQRVLPQAHLQIITPRQELPTRASTALIRERPLTADFLRRGIQRRHLRTPDSRHIYVLALPLSPLLILRNLDNYVY